MASTSAQGSTTIFVGGFAEETEAQDIHAAFAPFGDIVDLQLPPDSSEENKHRGFAFVTFSSAMSALDSVDNMHCNVLPGQPSKPLKVNTAKLPKALAMSGTNRAVWTDEAWLAEYATGLAPKEGAAEITES